MKNCVVLVLGACLLLSCQRGTAPLADGAAVPPFGTTVPAPRQDSERTWAGLLPCSDCQGIDTRLVLRSVGGRRDYLITETYVGGVGKNSFNRAGSWTEVASVADGATVTSYVLDPDQGGGQRFVLQADGALELRDGGEHSPERAIEYRLQRL